MEKEGIIIKNENQTYKWRNESLNDKNKRLFQLNESNERKTSQLKGKKRVWIRKLYKSNQVWQHSRNRGRHEKVRFEEKIIWLKDGSDKNSEYIRKLMSMTKE